MIYLDNAATSLRRPEGVVRAVSEALCSLGNVGRRAFRRARCIRRARKALYLFRRGGPVARVLHAELDRGAQHRHFRASPARRPRDIDRSRAQQRAPPALPAGAGGRGDNVPARRRARLHRLRRFSPRTTSEHTRRRLHARLQSHRQRAGRIPHRRFCARARPSVYPRRLADGGQL